MDMETLGTRMRRQREHAAISVRGLARICDLSASYVSRLERDELTPGEDALENIMRQLGVDRALYHEWFAAAGIIPRAIVQAMLARPAAWGAVSRTLMRHQ